MAKGASLRAEAPVPETAEQADSYFPLLAQDVGELQRIVEEARKEKDRILRQALEKAEKVRERINQRKQGLRIFAERNRQALAKGKTIGLPQGELYWKSGKGSVKVEDPAKVIEAIEALGLAEDLLIVKKKVSKAALLKHRAQAEQVKGVTFTKGTEQFYIRPRKLGVELPERDTSNIAKLILAAPKG